MTRDELVEDIRREVGKVLPENEELTGETLETFKDAVDDVLTTAEATLDETADEDDDEEDGDPEVEG